MYQFYFEYIKKQKTAKFKDKKISTALENKQFAKHTINNKCLFKM